MRDSAGRRLVKGIAVAIAILGLVWTATLILAGGFEFEIAGARLSTHEPLRPLLIASVALTVFILAGGIFAGAARLGSAVVNANHRLVASGLAAATFALGLMFGTTAASGADSYGYVSQVDLWLEGSLKISQPWAAEVPWPDRGWTFAPLGYRPAVSDDVREIVPTYSPGLPLLMAGAKWIAGQCAMFWIVPLMGAGLVLATYGIGERLGSSAAGMIGAWLVATSPPVLMLLMAPMTDVPVAAAWAGAFYFLLGTTRLSAVTAGALSGLAILIRPNLALSAAVLGSWYLLRLIKHRGPGRMRHFVAGALYSMPIVASGIVVALINRHLYGSATSSGYGRLADMFGWNNVLPNLRNYSGWLVEAQTIAFVAGLIALVVPVRRLWPGVRDRAVFVFIGAFIAVLWVQYLAYLVFDVWWYLRFILSSWPFLAVGAGAVFMMIYRAGPRFVRPAVAIIVLAIGVRGLWFAWDRSAFHSWQGERRYVSIGNHVRARTPQNSVIFSMQHSGSLRYYAGRVTLRYDALDGRWLDRAIAFFEERGVAPFLLLEEWELPDFTKRFRSQAALERLGRPPVFIYRGPAEILLWDLRGSRNPYARPEPIAETFRNLACVPPQPRPSLVLSADRRSPDK
jgi:hypothetical protein